MKIKHKTFTRYLLPEDMAALQHLRAVRQGERDGQEDCHLCAGHLPEVLVPIATTYLRSEKRPRVQPAGTQVQRDRANCCLLDPEVSSAPLLVPHWPDGSTRTV